MVELEAARELLGPVLALMRQHEKRCAARALENLAEGFDTRCREILTSARLVTETAYVQDELSEHVESGV
jgi:CHAD domain-containing protein